MALGFETKIVDDPDGFSAAVLDRPAGKRVLRRLWSGYHVRVKEHGSAWAKIEYLFNNKEYTGWVKREHLEGVPDGEIASQLDRSDYHGIGDFWRNRVGPAEIAINIWAIGQPFIYGYIIGIAVGFWMTWK